MKYIETNRITEMLDAGDAEGVVAALLAAIELEEQHGRGEDEEGDGEATGT